MNGRRILAGFLTGLMMITLAAGASAEWKEETRGGKVVRRSWVDENGAAAVSPEGYAVETLSYTGLTVTEKCYDLEGNPAQVLGGYYGQALTYGNRHRLEEIVFLDENGGKTESEAGYARVKINYMSTGDVNTAIYYDLYNDIVTVPSLGYAQVKNEYRGKVLTRTTYMDEKGNPVDAALGYAVMIQSVNKSNKIVGVRFEHADGSAAVGPEGWATMRRELDNKSRETSLKYYDLAGNLVDRGLGYAYESKKWESDRVCVVSRYDINNQRISMGPGYTSVKREWNKAGLVIRETYLDENGSITESLEGIAARKYTYDKEGRLQKVTFEGVRGDAKENNAGYGGYEDTLDASGVLVSRTYLSKGGSPVNVEVYDTKNLMGN